MRDIAVLDAASQILNPASHRADHRHRRPANGGIFVGMPFEDRYAKACLMDRRPTRCFDGTITLTRNEVYLSTDLVEPELRTEVWRAITRPFFETTPSPDDPQAPLAGSLRSTVVGSLLIGPTTFTAQQYRRDRGVILQGGLDQYLLQLFITGRLQGDCDGRPITVAPGDICVFDLARPLSSQVSAGSTSSIMLPRCLMDRAADAVSLHGRVLKAKEPVTRLLAEFILSLSGVAEAFPAADIQAMEEAAIRLLTTGLATKRNGEPIDDHFEDPALEPVLRRRLLDFIDANLADRQLGPALLMERFRVSRAHLYRMFAPDGGVARVVRERRLDAAYRLLTDHRASSRPLTETAYRLGFAGSSQFTRAFRSRFGLSPRDARQDRSLISDTDSGLLGLQDRFRRYAEQLGAPHQPTDASPSPPPGTGERKIG